MNKSFASNSQALAGTEPYGTFHGVEVRALMPMQPPAGVEVAPPSGIDFHVKPETCSVLTDEFGTQCRGPRAKGTEFCIGHLNAIKKAMRLAEEQKEEVKSDSEDNQ